MPEKAAKKRAQIKRKRPGFTAQAFFFLLITDY